MFRFKVIYFMLLGFISFIPQVYASHIDVTAEMAGNVLSIEISTSPDYQMTDEQKAAENEVLQKLTGGEVVIESSAYDNHNKARTIYDKLKGEYDIEEVYKNGQSYWKCIPKNPSTIIVDKVRYTEYTDSEGNTVHSSEHYKEEAPNPDYLADKETLERSALWFKIENKK